MKLILFEQDMFFKIKLLSRREKKPK